MGSRCRERNRLIRTELSIFLEREILNKEPTPKPNVKRPKKSQERPERHNRVYFSNPISIDKKRLEPVQAERTTIGPF